MTLFIYSEYPNRNSHENLESVNECAFVSETERAEVVCELVYRFETHLQH